METFSRYWPFVRGIHRSPVNSPHKGQWQGALMFTLICARINGWLNNREAGDLRRHRGHYYVNVMWCSGDERSRGIGKNDIDCVELGWFGPRKLKFKSLLLTREYNVSMWIMLEALIKISGAIWLKCMGTKIVGTSHLTLTLLMLECSGKIRSIWWLPMTLIIQIYRSLHFMRNCDYLCYLNIEKLYKIKTRVSQNNSAHTRLVPRSVTW